MISIWLYNTYYLFIYILFVYVLCVCVCVFLGGGENWPPTSWLNLTGNNNILNE